jgi:hypothetical protein
MKVRIEPLGMSLISTGRHLDHDGGQDKRILCQRLAQRGSTCTNSSRSLALRPGSVTAPAIGAPQTVATIYA